MAGSQSEPVNMEKRSAEERWALEAEFFDAEPYNEGPIDALTIARYTELKKPWLQAESAWAAIGEVTDKRVLEVGCGDGGNSILLALKGARVCGIDISPRAIEIAKKRAALHGVSDRVQFVARRLRSTSSRPPRPLT